jgi:hypothetical protein
MHLEGPWLSTTGKKRGKKKFASAAHARKARDLDDSWQQLLKKYETKPVTQKEKSKSLSDTYKLSIPDGRNTTSHIKSLDTGLGFAVKKESPKYTGTLIKGIATMHKSNAVPVINDEQAIEISKMRR